MEKSFIDAVQDFPSTGLCIPDRTKESPLPNHITARETLASPRLPM